jgi:hypothetical protein
MDQITTLVDEYANMTDEQLKVLEERLYDDELAGEDTWMERDQVLWEINRRGFSRKHEPKYSGMERP